METTDRPADSAPSGRGRSLGDALSPWSIDALEEFPELEPGAERDLAERARPGAFIYTVVWLIASMWGGLWSEHPVFSSVNLAILLGLSGLRMAYQRTLNRRADDASSTAHLLALLILAGALHWGVLSAWIVVTGDFGGLEYTFIVMLPAFAMGGTMILGISKPIRLAYPCLVFGPTSVGAAVVGGTENYRLVSLAVCALIYVLVASRTSSEDYWNARVSSKVAQDRAELLEIQSTTDPLTGLRNRLHFNNRYEEEWRRCAADRAPLSIVLIDVDYFKKINDTHGHLVGDECLKAIATALVGLRATDILARFGGEEFVAVLPHTDPSVALTVADRMVAAVADIEIDNGDQKIKVSCSAGIATLVPDSPHAADDLLLAADTALYKSKADGRNRATAAATSPDAESPKVDPSGETLLR